MGRHRAPAFSTTEWMKVTINGVVYEVDVTDDQTYTFRIFVTGGGTVTCGGNRARDGETLDVSAAKGETITMSIVPDDNGVVQYAKYSYVMNSQSLAVRTNNPLALNGTTGSFVVPDDIVDAPFVGRVGTSDLILEDTNAVVEVAFRSPLKGGADEASAVALQDSAVSHLNGGWYRVTQDITFDHTLYLLGDTHLILGAGATMRIDVPSANVIGVDSNKDNCGISSEYTLAVSGEGTLSVTVGTLGPSYESGTRNEHDIAICVGAYEQTGGTVWAEGYRGISCEGDY